MRTLPPLLVRKKIYALVVLIVLFVLILYIVLLFVGFTGERLFTFLISGLAVFLALLSLSVSAANAVVTTERARRIETLKAWSQWCDSTKDARLHLVRKFTRRHLSHNEIVLLNTPAERTQENIEKSIFESLSDLDDTKRKLANTLGGLERLGVGVEEGIYDVETLRGVGGTVIMMQYEKYKAYIESIQTHQDHEIKQRTCYRAFVQMAKEIEKQQTDLDRQIRSTDPEKIAARRRGVG